MEENLVRLIKVVIKLMAEQEWQTAEGLVEDILDQSHVALHQEKKEEIVEYIKSL